MPDRIAAPSTMRMASSAIPAAMITRGKSSATMVIDRMNMIVSGLARPAAMKLRPLSRSIR